MCTYNGEAYLLEQLISIINQSRLPDEMHICDDKSTDHTREILESFVSNAPFPIYLHFNERNLGPTKNFEKAISFCSSDIIVLSDQDDVWSKNKLERLESSFQLNPKAGLVFTDAEIVNEKLQPTGHSLWHYTFWPKEQNLFRKGKAFKVLTQYNVITGATMAFRAKYKDLILPIPNGLIAIHDGWIALLIAAVSEIVFIPETTIKYRQHKDQDKGIDPLRDQDRNSIGNKIPSNLKLENKTYEANIYQCQIIYERLESMKSIFRCKDSLKYLDQQIKHYQTRANIPKSRIKRIPILINELLSLRYHHYSTGLASFAKDLLL
jgi:glycosyltransferase involved in cell wall biosynthesis